MGNMRRYKGKKELRFLFLVVAVVFAVALALPLICVLGESFLTEDGALTLVNYAAVFTEANFLESITNSLTVSALAAFISMSLALLLAYTVNCTNMPPAFKKAVGLLTQMPMLLPTITYGFAIIYSFGRQGLLTNILGFQPFDIYGFNGLLIGYVIYTLPISFLLINNSFHFVDKRFMIVSRIMGDSGLATFVLTVLRPLAGSMCVAFILSFFLSFTDYGIPTSVGGTYNVVALQLYNQMLGSVPDFNRGAVIALVMLIPSLLSIVLMTLIERHSIRYDNVSPIEIPTGRVRDAVCGAASVIVLLGVISVFAVILIVPFVEMWPFKLTFTLDHVASVFTDPDLANVLTNSLLVAFLTAVFGCLIAYAAALITARSDLSASSKRSIDSIASIINTVPGMVLGVGYLLLFSGTPLQGGFFILVLCNIVHYFATPYQMMKDSLTKMNASWETTASLMGDSWIKTVIRIITPNALPTILQVFGYYFVNAMVTISAVVFLTSAHTMVITTKISSLQHVADFDSIFAISLVILVINLLVKGIIALITRPRTKKRPEPIVAVSNVKSANKRTILVVGIAVMLCLVGFAAYDSTKQTRTAAPVNSSETIIYTNADEEAIDSYRAALDENGYAGQYLIQSFSTNELGGKLTAEGSNIEADVVTMSSYYLDNAQESNTMFADLTDLSAVPLDASVPSYRAEAQAQEGAIFYNTTVIEQTGLPVPTSLKDLADPLYEGMVSVPDIKGSSTGWLMIMTLIDAYGEDEACEILTGIYRNAGPYLSQSGSAPIKNVRAGEVAIGFGLRHQSIADAADGLPIATVDPSEGTYALTESVAVIDHGENTDPNAQAMAALLIDAGREQIMETYPRPLYEGESAPANAAANERDFPETLTIDLLKRHQELSEHCKTAAQ